MFFLKAVPREGVTDPEFQQLPEEGRQIQKFTLAHYARAGFEPPWISYFAFDATQCVGTCAFKTAPYDNRVEIAYFTFPQFQKKGYATQMAMELCQIAATQNPNLIVAAQTLPEHNASTAILKKLGFQLLGAVDHPEDGTVWEWQLAPEIKMPPESEGFIPTLNQTGFMTTGLDPISQAFTEFAAQAKGEVLEIGAAYGVATLEALKKGAKVIANDLEQSHLNILVLNTPPALKKNLKTVAGRFPEDLDFPHDSLEGILICRVMHFFTPEQVTLSARNLFQWLKPGGKIFIVAETVYVSTVKSGIETYEKKVAAQHPWPGFFEDIHQVNPALKGMVPKVMHLFDPEVLTRVFTQAGFTVEKTEVLARKDFPKWLQMDGRESVGLIARKQGVPDS